jgi:predicted DNA-binding protein (MmcQ/YjbR family)
VDTRQLENLAELCRALPGSTEEIKWRKYLTFSVGGKLFCIFAYENKRLLGMSFKVPDHRFLEYTDRPQFIPAPYLARARWVTAVEGQGLSAEEMKKAVRESYGLVFAKLPKRVQTSLSR